MYILCFVPVKDPFNSCILYLNVPSVWTEHGSQLSSQDNLSVKIKINFSRNFYEFKKVPLLLTFIECNLRFLTLNYTPKNRFTRHSFSPFVLPHRVLWFLSIYRKVGFSDWSRTMTFSEILYETPNFLPHTGEVRRGPYFGLVKRSPPISTLDLFRLWEMDHSPILLLVVVCRRWCLHEIGQFKIFKSSEKIFITVAVK